MVCAVCGKVLLPSRAVFRCSCGIVTHALCWEKHIVQSHRPPYTLGHVDLDGKFRPKEAASKAEKLPAEKGLVTAGKARGRDADKRSVGSDSSLGVLKQMAQSSNENGYQIEEQSRLKRLQTKGRKSRNG